MILVEIFIHQYPSVLLLALFIAQGTKWHLEHTGNSPRSCGHPKV